MSDKKQITFEDALRELEDIADKLEKGQLSLEESIKAYERGMDLKKVCTDRLTEAEAKIEFLAKGQTGEIVKTTVKKKKEDTTSKNEDDLF
ncbi:exodeoxyribonuclease VII small subunit [Leptospira ilyithenensis]|uniref:Exodeoxyribonuclease 7 small subunit n=1 Tax=Leptospira ilyithenensis TaxID=2484901 RepID=A0A4R9LP28_9LEPT|nr:exodeoxyribonuclease VII small subunit [Leptospira ilyithenensis]TGN08439.1 exodeoxyribonuclease VII small subunit [Leptospira ilyithenensis]